jgi:hypothetical protein
MEDRDFTPETPSADPTGELTASSPEPQLSAHFAPPVADVPAPGELQEAEESRRRKLLHNLALLLPLCLIFFTLITWMLIHADSPFGMFSGGPEEIVRAQLAALNDAEFLPAYDMFSTGYRSQVSFVVWHELAATHLRMFQSEVVRSEFSSATGPGVKLELFLHGPDERDYRARYSLIYQGGRWWIDDVHWTLEADERDVSRI